MVAKRVCLPRSDMEFNDLTFEERKQMFGQKLSQIHTNFQKNNPCQESHDFKEAQFGIFCSRCGKIERLKENANE